MLCVMAFACQFTVAHTLGHNCSYPCVGGRVYAKGLGGGTGDPLQPSPGIEADSRKTQPSSEEQEILSVVQGRMGCE